MPIAEAGRRVRFRGTDHAEHYLLSDTILWIESAASGRHAIVQVGHEAIEVTATVRAIKKTYPDLFFQCHSCYLVNLRHVRQIMRFEVMMTDGSKLPIPEKKYTAFKTRMNEYWENAQSWNALPCKASISAFPE